MHLWTLLNEHPPYNHQLSICGRQIISLRSMLWFHITCLLRARHVNSYYEWPPPPRNFGRFTPRFLTFTTFVINFYKKVTEWRSRVVFQNTRIRISTRRPPIRTELPWQFWDGTAVPSQPRISSPSGFAYVSSFPNRGIWLHVSAALNICTRGKTWLPHQEIHSCWG
jgi:hypothetical protein